MKWSLRFDPELELELDPDPDPDPDPELAHLDTASNGNGFGAALHHARRVRAPGLQSGNWGWDLETPLCMPRALTRRLP